jgi:tetratricopeptide (TPR) repeat protein
VIESLLEGERLLLHGLVDRAERLYRGILEQDPRNAIALVGLARVAVERGEDRLAYRRATEALEIDPDNIAAGRMAARLAEILAGADEPVEHPVPPEEPEAERAVLDRNPSMADHRQAEERRARRQQAGGDR